MHDVVAPEADKPRVVCDYSGVQIIDARHHVRVVFKGDPPKGARYCLKDAGFQATPDGAWQRPMSPDAVFQAQNIVALFFPTSP